MESVRDRARYLSARVASLPAPVLFLLIYAAVALGHLTLLHLPYYWDEGGYYIPAALDFYHTGQLIPRYTNAHPPLPNVLLGTLWHIVGFHILATRLMACSFAALGLCAVFRLAQRLMDPTVAVLLTALTAVYPIWFAQSSLAHADIFAAAFTLWAFALYIPSANTEEPPYVLVALLFALAALSKETAIIEPAALAAWEIVLLLRKSIPSRRDHHVRWILALAFPALPLIAWFEYHHHVTGFTFGNPEYLRYNATANFTATHIFQSFRYRFLHLFWQRNIWVPIVFALACLFLAKREHAPRGISSDALSAIAVLVVANWLAFSVLGGALLTRYLLPVYPLTLMVCLGFWRTRTRRWPVFAAATAIAFVSALWMNPPTAFAPEDNLTYRDMIVVHEEAIDFVAQHYPDATVLTAWPVTTDIFRPELGYVRTPMKVVAIEDFTLPEIQKAALGPERYDTAIVFTTHFIAPEFRRYLAHHPNSTQGRDFAAHRDLTPAEIAGILGGQIVWQDTRGGEWAAVLRFDRAYDARLLPLLRWPVRLLPHGLVP